MLDNRDSEDGGILDEDDMEDEKEHTGILKTTSVNISHYHIANTNYLFFTNTYLLKCHRYMLSG